LPQRNTTNGIDDRTLEQKAFFKFQLPLISHIILETIQVVLWKKEGLNSGWCCVENIISNVVMQDLNKTINSDIPIKNINSYLTAVVDNISISKAKYKFPRVYSNSIADKSYEDIMNWFQSKIDVGNNQLDFYGMITKELIFEMIIEFNLTFTNGSDKEFVATLLHKIFQRLGDKKINITQLSGSNNLFHLWHYIRGTYGNCVLPSFAYEF
jgi:hypothetical protein